MVGVYIGDFKTGFIKIGFKIPRRACFEATQHAEAELGSWEKDCCNGWKAAISNFILKFKPFGA